MRVIVEARFGPLDATRAVLAPGAAIRVGRNNLLDLSFPHDAQLSAEHLAITWDGVRCRVRDLGSAGGTFVGGEQIEDVEVASGSWVRAGTTNLMVYFEGHTPPRLDDLRAAPELARAALDCLRGVQEPLYAIVDASRGPRVLELLYEAVDVRRSLYEGTQGDALARVAPYLVKIDPTSGLLERLVTEGWGSRWGVFLTSTRPFKEVRRHLRRFLVVETDESSDKLLFRYYDPSTLRAFLPSATPRQRQDIFDGVIAFFVEGERGEPVRFDP